MRRWHVVEQFVRKNDWKYGAELGVWDGRFFRHLMTQCPQLYLVGVDLYEAQPESTGPEKWIPGENGHPWDHELYYDNIKKFVDFIGRGRIIKDYTTNAAKLMKDESLDFIFIDADHSEEGVRNDIELWTPKVKKGGMIFGHDIDWPSVKKVVEEKYGTKYYTSHDNVWYVYN